MHSATTRAREIVFVDPGVSDIATLLGHLRPEVEAILLDPVRRAARQMATALAEEHDLAAIHVIAHGAPGRVDFIAGEWSAVTLADNAEDFAAIGTALAAHGDLRLWSCQTAAGPAGAAFVTGLAQAVGADIAAATGLIGAAALGGTWRMAAAGEPPLTATGATAYARVLASYDQELALRPGYAEARDDRGAAPRESAGRPETAAPGPETVTSDPQSDLQVALEHHQAGRLADAEEIYRKILAGNAKHVDCLHLLGVLGVQLGRTDEAIELLQQALDLNPDLAEAHNNLGVALRSRGEPGQAVSHWEKAVALKPDYVDAYDNLARGLAQLDRTGLALACWQRALALQPDHVQALADFAAALQRANRFDEAVAHYQRALALRPDHVELHCSFAAAQRSAGRLADAVAGYEQALVLAPDHVGAHVGVAGVLELQGRTGDATAHFERALALRPDLADLRFRLCTAQLPILYQDEAEIEGRRAAYCRQLQRLSDDVEAGRGPGDLAAAVGSNQPFFLPYQGQNDRELQSLYGRLVCRIIADKHPAAPLLPPPAADEKVRVGIVSGLFRHHTVWKLMIRGWLSQLDRQKFQLFGYHTGADRDGQTEVARIQCDRFVQGPLSGDRWREEILADRPHILIYPDIGMDPGAAWIAAHRLAPTQCVSWGHPNTTGYPTIDYFLSSALMEPPDAELHYTERLVRLPNLSIWYEPLDLSTPPIGRDQLGLRPGSVAYWCGQSLFKYLPQYDHVFARIAREVGDCQFLFIASHHGGEITERMRRRLARAFAVLGLDADRHCVFLSRLGLEQFVAAIGQCDIVLDSICWSGGNSTLEGLAHDTPIVTLPGPLMRSRHTMAILTRIGLTETIANDVDDYVSIAVRLARDPAWRTELKQRIANNKNRVYCDSEAIVALEDFLCRAACGEAKPLAEQLERPVERPPRSQPASQPKPRLVPPHQPNDAVIGVPPTGLAPLAAA
jgi:predicted O-linked N-acetylglucosamine transferase (SPINDLY family)